MIYHHRSIAYVNLKFKQGSVKIQVVALDPKGFILLSANNKMTYAFGII